MSRVDEAHRWESTESTRPFSTMGTTCIVMLCSTCRVFTESAAASTSFSDSGSLPCSTKFRSFGVGWDQKACIG